MELWSQTFRGLGTRSAAYYKEPAQSPVSTPELYKKYPLIMISGTRSRLFFHAEHRMIPWLREKMPDPLVEIHPDTAKELGIYDGEWVYIENDLGRVKRKAKHSPHRPSQNDQHHAWLVDAGTGGRGAQSVRRMGVPDQPARSRDRRTASPASAAASTRRRW